MPDECRPPVGVLAGQWCVLVRGGAELMIAQWLNDEWHWSDPMGGRIISQPRHMTDRKWSYYSIAEVPHD